MRNTYKSQENRSFITCKATCLHPKALSHSSFASLCRPVCLHNLFVLWKFPQIPCICHSIYSSVSSSSHCLQSAPYSFQNSLTSCQLPSRSLRNLNSYTGESHCSFHSEITTTLPINIQDSCNAQLIQKLDISQKFFSLLILSSFVTTEQIIISRHLGSQHLQGRENKVSDPLLKHLLVLGLRKTILLNHAHIHSFNIFYQC